MPWSPGDHEEGACSCHSSAVQGVHQTLDEMDFERGMETGERCSCELAEAQGIWNAALNGDLEGVKRHILSHGKPSEPDPFGYTALHYASRNGHYDVCHFLLGSGASCNARTHGGATPLHRAAYCGHTAIARLLLDHGADPAATDDGGKTCLHKAAENGHQELCELLLEHHSRLRHLQDNNQRRPGDLVPAKNEVLRRKLLDL